MIFQFLTHFLIGFITSFLGSIPLGSINAGVARISITQNKKAAHLFILGATLAELIYSCLAIHFSSFLVSIPNFDYYIRILSIPIFILIGISYFLIQPKKNAEEPDKTKSNYVVQGLLIGLLNPLQIPFWLAYGTYFISVGWILKDVVLLNWFIVGIIIGSSCLLILIAKFASLYGEKYKINNRKINLITGGIFIILAAYQLLLLFIR